MRAIVVADDKQGTMSIGEAPTPEAGPGEVRIRIAATAVNRADLLQRRGRYPVPAGASPILGLEASGTIDQIGEGVSSWSVGDEVCVLLEGGGYAEYVVVDERMPLPVPAGISLVDAAAVPEVFYTAFLNLYLEGNMQPGERALVHAAASGVGTAALQLCRALGNPCIATASAEKLPLCTELGADIVIDRKSQSFKEEIETSVGKRSIDVILDPVGGAYLEDNIKVLASRGRLVIIGLLGGASADASLGQILMKRVRIIGSVLRSRSRAEKVEITAAMRARVWPLFASGELKPVIHATMPLSQANEAHGLLEQNATSGKVVLTID